MGNLSSTRWSTTHQVRRPLEKVRRALPHEAELIEAETTSTSVSGTSAKRRWLVCPDCGARCGYLYESDGSRWICRQCARLCYERELTKGTRAKFYEWFTPRRFRFAWKLHRAAQEFDHARQAAIDEVCAPYDWDAADLAQRFEMRTQYGGREATLIWFNKRREAVLLDFSEWESQVAEQIHRDVYAVWCARNRSKPKPRPRSQQRTNEHLTAENAASF